MAAVSVLEEQKIDAGLSEKAVVIVVVSENRDYESSPRTQLVGKTCHQCRQKTKAPPASCKNQRINKPCPLLYCEKCLMNRYGVRADEVDALKDWHCPKCRDMCNCSICMKRRGEKPTGHLISKVKSNGYTSVMDLLLSDQKDEVLAESTRSKQKSVSKKVSDIMFDVSGGGEGSDQKTHSDDDNVALFDSQIYPLLPQGVEIFSVANVMMAQEDIGNALQFLEFYTTFGEILNLEEGQGEAAIRDLKHGDDFSTSISLQMHLLSFLLEEKKVDINLLCNELGLSCILIADVYKSVEFSEKLKLLNHICDEILGTEMVRGWMISQQTKHIDRLKKARQKYADANEKTKGLCEETRPKVEDGIVEKVCETSSSDFDAAKAQAKMLQLEYRDFKNNCAVNAMRTEAIWISRGGEAYWKLNCLKKSTVLRQEFCKGDMQTFGEKWFVLDCEGEEAIEKLAASQKGGRRRSKRSRGGGPWNKKTLHHHTVEFQWSPPDPPHQKGLK